MIYLFTAFYAEAQCVIAHYKLKKDTAHTHFQLFENKELKIRLILTGAGNIAAARAAAAMGYKRIITYTLESENGASLRASGWICQGKAGGLRWTGKRQPKEDQYPAQMKLRYEKQLGKEETVNGICSGPEGS